MFELFVSFDDFEFVKWIFAIYIFKRVNYVMKFWAYFLCIKCIFFKKLIVLRMQLKAIP